MVWWDMMLHEYYDGYIIRVLRIHFCRKHYERGIKAR